MTETATLAGGCFWGMQELMRRLPGVLGTRVGYTGGTTASPQYRDITTGATGHAESLEVTFDPERIGYRNVLELFFQIHDPTTENRQGNDRGSQYRSVIFFGNEEQERIARDTIADVEASGLWPGPVVTELVPAGEFWEAEEAHQDYLQRNPGGYTCHFPRPNWRLPRRNAAE
jgi:peptide-methionine (S)-S-oxide reductase